MINVTVANVGICIACNLRRLAISGSRHGHDGAGDEELSPLSSRLAECVEEEFSDISTAPWSYTMYMMLLRSNFARRATINLGIEIGKLQMF